MVFYPALLIVYLCCYSCTETSGHSNAEGWYGIFMFQGQYILYQMIAIEMLTYYEGCIY